MPVGIPHLDLLPDRRHGGHGRDEPILDPTVADPAGVGGGADVAPSPGPVGSVTGKKVAVLLVGELGQLVEGDKVVGFALVVELVLGVLEVAEHDLRPRREPPRVGGGVIPRLGKDPGVVSLRLFHQLRELRICLAQDQRLIMRDVHLPQSLHYQRIGLPATGRAAVQSLILWTRHKSLLAGLWCPNHPMSHGLPPVSYLRS